MEDSDMTNKRQHSSLTLGDAIRFLRGKKGISARALSLESGLSPSYVSKIESGQIKEPSLEAFASIAKSLKMSEPEMITLVRLYENQC